MDPRPPIVELDHVSKGFPDRATGELLPAVQDVSLAIPDEEAGEFLVLLGPSGCGKSTVLNMISGLLAPDGGEVRILGQPVVGPSPLSATVPQAYTCFPWLTALGNVEFGLALLGQPKAQRERLATEYLNRVGLGDRLDAYPKQLSGGMQQRVAIARTLATRPSVVLMDEPFGALDAQTRTAMQEMLLSLWTEEKNLIIFVTHDITEGLLLADRIVVFSARPAQVVRDLRVPFHRPRSATLVHAADFINLSQELLQLLKSTPGRGEVRVSV